MGRHVGSEELGFDAKDVEDLKAVLAWWRIRERSLSVIQGVIPTTKRSVRSFRIEDEVYEALRVLSEDQGRSMGELANEAMRWYVAGA